MIAAILAGCGIAYSILAIVAILRFHPAARISNSYRPRVSILKPVRGRDARFFEAIRSHAAIGYPRFEILFGVAVENDPALQDIARLAREYAHLAIRVVDTVNDAANGKVGSLEILARAASYDVFVVNDGDIRVEPDYLDRVIGLLEDPAVGLVTCLYRASAASWASEAEAIGIVTEFAPSVLVSRLLSHSDFALGSTMAFRRADLEKIGGFAALRNYLADDYQLGNRIAGLGKRVVLANAIVETNLGAGSLADVWKHQVRWSRTIRVSRPSGYFGYIVTQLTFWSVVACIAGYPLVGAAGILVRLITAALALAKLDRDRMKRLWAVPFRDLFGLAVWFAGMLGTEVEWRGLRFRLRRDGTIQPIQ